MVCLFASTATAQPGDLTEARVALHATAPTANACTAAAPDAFGCDANQGSSLSITWPVGSEAAVYVVVLDVNPEIGVQGITFVRVCVQRNPIRRFESTGVGSII